MTDKGKVFSKIAKAAAAVALLQLAAGCYVYYRRKKAGKKEEGNQNSDYKNYEVFMGGRNICIEDEAFSGAGIHSVMSGVSLDLTKARLDTDIRINIKNVFAGIHIKVPAGVNVRCDGKYLFSSVIDAVPDYEGKDVHTIYIEAKLLFSGLSIHAEQRNDDIIKDYFEINSQSNWI